MSTPDDRINTLEFEAMTLINEMAMVTGASQRVVEAAFQRLSRTIIARSRDAKRNAEHDQAEMERAHGVVDRLPPLPPGVLERAGEALAADDAKLAAQFLNGKTDGDWQTAPLPTAEDLI